MDEKYQQLISELASKLGTTAEHLWGVLVRQAPISGATDLLCCAVATSAALWWVKMVAHKTTAPSPTPENRYPTAEWREEAQFFAWLSAFIVGLIAVLMVVGSLDDIAAAFANPEYWALQQLLRH